MQKFKTIYARALKRKGDEKQLKRFLPKAVSTKKLAKVTDDRCLSEMSRCVFQAGFVWRVVNKKWPDFEKVFFGFAPEKLVLLSPEQIENIGKNPAIIRNMQKIISVQKNAQMILDQAKEHGSFAGLISQWPTDDQVNLFKYLKQRGSRLGGATGPRALRNLGYDTFMFSGDVVKAVQLAGVDIADQPSSQKDMRAMQEAFNQWHKETGLPYSHLSRIAACSVGENYPAEAFGH
ncbi:MAG: DNA-3-methyladenine glycosylase I [Pseudomonadales bacterium]